MKKYLALILGVLFVLSFAASAFAIHAEIPAETQSVVAKGTSQITLGGEIRTRGWYRDNIGTQTYGTQTTSDDVTGLGKSTHSQAWWDQRVRLSLEATVAPGVVGFVQIESTSKDSGDKYVWGSGGETTDSNFKGSDGVESTNSKPNGTLNVLQSWIQYSGSGLFSFPTGVKIGHMPLKLSYGQFFDNTQYGDDAAIFYMDPIKGLHVAALTFKGAEGATVENTDDLDGYVALTTFKWNDTNTVGANFAYLNRSDDQLKMQNLGLHADGSFAGLGYRVAGDIQFGSVGDGPTEADFGGYAVSAAVNYRLDPVNLRGSFVYGSGDDKADNDLDEFIPFVGNIQNYSFIYEYQHATTASNQSKLNAASPTDGHSAGVANTTYFNLGVDYSPTKDLGLSLDGYYFMATETPSNVDDSAGWEIDAKIKYALAKNLTYQIDAGYFDTGDFYEDAYGIKAKGVTAIRHALTLSF